MIIYLFLLHVILKFCLIVVIIMNIYVFITVVLIQEWPLVLMLVWTSFDDGEVEFEFIVGLCRFFLRFGIVR